jgi:hypothetical protein
MINLDLLTTEKNPSNLDLKHQLDTDTELF